MSFSLLQNQTHESELRRPRLLWKILSKHDAVCESVREPVRAVSAFAPNELLFIRGRHF